jgi:transcriptional antiterminator RfaH
MDRAKEDSVSVQWYVIQSHANKEESLKRQLELKGITCFHPTLRVKPVNPRSRKIRPLFPGYLFVSLDLDQTNVSDLQWMPNTAGLVCFGGEPARVPDNLIEVLKRKITIIDAEAHSSSQGLQPGDAVIIQGGPLEGFEGIFQTHLSGHERVQILLKLLSNQSVPVDLPDWQVAPRKKKRAW